MGADEPQSYVTDLAEGALSGPEWERWLQAHPEEAAEIEIARRVLHMMRQLASAEIAVPQNFEAHLMARIHEDRTLLNLLELFLADVGGVLIELIKILLSTVPTPPQPATT